MSPTRSSNSLYAQVQDQIQSYLSPTHDVKNLYPRPLHVSPEPPNLPNYHRPGMVCMHRSLIYVISQLFLMFLFSKHDESNFVFSYSFGYTWLICFSDWNLAFVMVSVTIATVDTFLGSKGALF